MDAVVYTPLAKLKTGIKIKTGTVISGSLLIIVSLLIKIVSSFPFFIEKYYSRGVYPYISTFYRRLFGWIPFSIGDIFYFGAGCYIFWLVFKIIRTIYQGRITKINFLSKVKSLVFALLTIYIYFNLSWGLNYNRPGIASQLSLSPQLHEESDLKNITSLLRNKVNESRREVSFENAGYKSYIQVFDQAQQAFETASADFPFMAYKTASVKRSMYGRMGNFLGFLGYYNPFTGEAQLNLTMPRFLIPYVACHEMAHQLGYASESEASFVGYLASMKSKDARFQYSTYFDLFNYANHELYVRDSAAAKSNYKQLGPLVKTDMEELKEYWRKSDNLVEPVIKLFYDHYLKANQQSNGVKSYNEVIGWLIAYHKKYGKI